MPLFEFGFGLSYTIFDLDQQLTVKSIHSITSPLPSSIADIMPGGNPDLYNGLLNSDCKEYWYLPCATVLQLYVFLQVTSVPERTLVKVFLGFEKAYLSANDVAPPHFALARGDLSFWKTTVHD
jgi:hypothetical protein